MSASSSVLQGPKDPIEIEDREGETVDLGAIASLQIGECHLIVGYGEIEVDQEAAGISGSEFA
ncbi:hypothetical protein [Mycobacterium leprae]|uniref:hypothetical protein n=1 Tax=Mycobacterium leprae TaxID=1769 RepID=UPI0011AE8AAA|nr:hypothetical protein [Mycobacterium leprae]